MSMMYDVYSSETSLQIVHGVECNQDIFDSEAHSAIRGRDSERPMYGSGQAMEGVYAQTTGGDRKLYPC